MKMYLIEFPEKKQGRTHIAARFRPNADRLNEIANNGQKLLQTTSDKDLTEFTESASEFSSHC